MRAPLVHELLRLAVVVVFRCQNGVVSWLLHVVSIDHAEALCINDNIKLQLSVSADATWSTQLRSMATHAIALSGAILETIVLPSVIH